MNPIYSLVIIVPATIVAYFLSRRDEPENFKRYQNLDGLRGFAALFVFVSHASLFYFLDTTGSWRFPRSDFGNNFYNQCGSGAVTMFFMMSSFLFYGKIRENPIIDWKRVYASRITRLFPMYYLSCLLGLSIVWLYRQNNHITMDNVLHILAFNGVGNMLGVENVPLMTNGTAWTLPYEWLLYLSLPLIWVVVQGKKDILAILFSLALLLVLVKYAQFLHLDYKLCLIFVTGMMAYEMTKFKVQKIKKLASGLWGSLGLVFAGILVVGLSFYSSGHPLEANNSISWPISLLLYSFIFFIITLGNNFFGVLTSAAARKLGEISYSFYLLQFIFLNLFFRILFTKNMPVLEHFVLASLSCITLLLVSNITFSHVEKRFMVKSGSWGKHKI